MKAEVKSEKEENAPPEKRISRPQGKPTYRPTPKFEGRCDDLKGLTFDYSDSRQSDKYAHAMR